MAGTNLDSKYCTLTIADRVGMERNEIGSIDSTDKNGRSLVLCLLKVLRAEVEVVAVVVLVVGVLGSWGRPELCEYLFQLP